MAQLAAPAAPAPAPQAQAGPPLPARGQVAGKPRSYGISVLLFFVTFGIYGLVYQYKVYAELDRQHGREHHQVWFWLQLIPWAGVVFGALYHAKEIPQLQEYRRARGMDDGVTVAYFLLWALLGALILVGPFIAYHRLNKAANQLWRAIYQENGVPYPL